MDIKIPYKPRDWQKNIHQEMKRYNVLVVHRGAGKSILAINHLIKAALKGPANAEYAYILPQLNQGRRNVWDPLKRFVEPLEKLGFANLNNADMTCRLPNGAKIMLLGADNPESLRGLHLHGVVLDEFADMHPNTWTAVRPMTTNHKAWVIWIGTPKGENKFYDFYQVSQDPSRQHNWYGKIMTWKDTGALDESEIEEVRLDLSPEAFAQEMECSFNAALVGSYYSGVLEKLETDRKIVHTSIYRPDLPVHTAWDLGVRDSMVVWYYQLVGSQINVLRCDQDNNMGMVEWVAKLNNYQDKMRAEHNYFQYGFHWAPHDINQRELMSGVSRIEQAANLGIYFSQVPKHGVQDGIDLVRRYMTECQFYKPECTEGLKSLRHYCAKTDRSGLDQGPKHDQYSHAADAFRYLMVSVKQGHNNGTSTRFF